jgi:hypothetical protein
MERIRELLDSVSLEAALWRIGGADRHASGIAYRAIER